jgi:hypothetical protein
MNNKLSKAFIKHYNVCFSALKGLINRLQNLWKLHTFWNLLHKPWHNNIFKIMKFFEIFFWKLFKEYSKKYSTKSRWVQLVLSCLHPLTIHGNQHTWAYPVVVTLNRLVLWLFMVTNTLELIIGQIQSYGTIEGTQLWDMSKDKFWGSIN